MVGLCYQLKTEEAGWCRFYLAKEQSVHEIISRDTACSQYSGYYYNNTAVHKTEAADLATDVRKLVTKYKFTYYKVYCINFAN